MPVTQKTYPEWVQKYREKGTTVKKKEMPTTSINALQNAFPEKSILSL